MSKTTTKRARTRALWIPDDVPVFQNLARLVALIQPEQPRRVWPYAAVNIAIEEAIERREKKGRK